MPRRGLTEFTYTRWLVPFLSGYKGWSIFMDADMLVMDDINEFWDMKDDTSDVMLVKNKERFEWPSMMFFNNRKCKKLTPEYIAKENPYTFEWANKIGELPSEWNHCVGYDEPRDDAKLAHFTTGIPCFPETEQSEYGDKWREELRLVNMTCSWIDLMGNSVHLEKVKRDA